MQPGVLPRSDQVRLHLRLQQHYRLHVLHVCLLETNSPVPCQVLYPVAVPHSQHLFSPSSTHATARPCAWWSSWQWLTAPSACGPRHHLRTGTCPLPSMHPGPL